jgi:xanthine dehydrogenase YagR molybdenum-binding subunit
VTTRWIGRDLERVDGRKKVTGTATYAAETAVGQVAHAAIVGATIGRGRVVAIDTAAAEKTPGVLAVITHANAPKLPGALLKSKPNDRVVQVLQDDSVRYHDQPIALVVAERLEQAQHAAALVRARYAEEPAVGELEADLASAVAPASAGGPTSAADSKRGDADLALAAAAVRLELTYTTPVETHNPMEPHATIAVWRGADSLTLYDSTQGIFAVRRRLAEIFGLEPQAVRVISHFVGGGFGGKGAPWSHVALAALGARVTGRPVKLAITRPQMQSLVGHRPKTVQKLAIGAEPSGHLLALRHDVVSETSRFDEFTEGCSAVTRMLYACPNVTTSQRLVKLDIPTPTYMRAPGESTGTFALESALDELAWKLRLDPIELRRRNHADVDPIDGRPWSSKSLLACYQAGAERFGWSDRKPAIGAMRAGDWRLGMGVATATRPSPQQPASARARLLADGRVIVEAGTQDIGTGTYTILTQVAADALALPVEAVRFELGDSSFPESPPSVGSFTAASCSNAVHQACRSLIAKLIERAVADERSPLHGLSVAGVAALDGALVAAADPSRREPYAAAVARSGQAELVAEAETRAGPERESYSMHAFGAIFAGVRVDPDIGELRVDRLVGAFACGTILNARTARSQLLGGMVWGLGMATRERSVRDPRSGRMVTRDLADYHVPVHADVPPIDVILVPEEDRYVNELGVKGLGEIGVTGVAAAIANAVHHAIGVRVRDLPITIEQLLG